jgi:lipopolysaccharide heptosyltransferase II
MQNVSKILIIRFSSMGDIVLTSPFVRVLRKKFPQAQIDFLTKEEFGDLVRYNPNLSSLITLKSDSRDELKTLAVKLHETKYDILFDLHNSIRSRYLRKLIKAGETYIVNKRVVARFFLVNFKWNFYKEVIPVSQRYIETGRTLGAVDDNKGPEIFFPDSVRKSMSTVLGDFLSESGTIIGFSPTAKHATKLWQSEKFVELGSRVALEYGAKILIFGGPGDVQYCENIAANIDSVTGKHIALSCAGKFSLLETAAAIDHCSFMVTNDSGVMHLASARGKKIIAIFGSTVKEFGFFPQGKECIVLENKDLQCRPCSHIGRDKCPQGHFKCMTEISVDDVMKAAEALLPVKSAMNVAGS